MTDKPTIHERYVRASSASRLRIREHYTGSLEVVIAAGWSRPAIGTTLMRLQNEFDLRISQRKHASAAAKRLSISRLRSLPQAKAAVVEAAKDWDAPHKAIDVLLWWLDQTCPVCKGTQYKVIPNTNRQSAQPCGFCKGTGKTRCPYGNKGQVLAGWLDECVYQAKRGMRKRLSVGLQND